MPIGYQLKGYTDAERALLEHVARQRGISIEQAEIALVKEWAKNQPDIECSDPISVTHFPELDRE